MRPILFASVVAAIAVPLFSTVLSAATIIATGQNNGDPTHTSGNYYYSIDTSTGIATPISPQLTGSSPAGLSAVGTQLVGFKDSQHGVVNPVAGTFSPVGASNGLSITGYEVLGGSGYGVPTSGPDRRLQQINLATSVATAIGTGTPIATALDTFFANPAGTNSPFIISMGSVGSTLYGVHLGTGKNNLVALDPTTGSATVLGTANAVGTSGNPGVGSYSGFAAMTGVDSNNDGVYDQLFGNVNFFDPDASGPLASQRLGGVARYDLNNGTWTLVGTNPGLIFFGFGSPIPEPATLSVIAGAAVLGLRRRSRC
jgi:hypothetical protein